MTTSTNGQLCYGIFFEDGYEFPWDSEKYDGDLESWWLYEVCKYQDPFVLYNSKGDYIDGRKPPDEKETEYYNARHEFKDAHPCPVELVNYCSCDYPMYILAVSDQVKFANRGYPQEITQEDLTALVCGLDILTQFCQEHGIETDEEPKLWLSSLWC